MNWLCLQEGKMSVYSCQALLYHHLPTLFLSESWDQKCPVNSANNSNLRSREGELPVPKLEPRLILENLHWEASISSVKNWSSFVQLCFPRTSKRNSDYGGQREGNLILNTHHLTPLFILSVIPFLLCLLTSTDFPRHHIRIQWVCMYFLFWKDIQETKNMGQGTYFLLSF